MDPNPLACQNSSTHSQEGRRVDSSIVITTTTLKCKDYLHLKSYVHKKQGLKTEQSVCSLTPQSNTETYVSSSLKRSVGINSSVSNFKFSKNQNIQLRGLNPQDVFLCGNCQPPGSRKCFVCKGARNIDKESNYVKFLEFILEFKCGFRDGYTCQSQKLRPEASQGFSNPDKSLKKSQSIWSSVKIRDYIQKISLEKSLYQDYECNICEMDPIKGTRYHCSDVDCGDNYDLCESCYLRNGHRHKDQIKAVNFPQIESKIKVLSNKLVRSSKLESSSQGANLQLFQKTKVDSKIRTSGQ